MFHEKLNRLLSNFIMLSKIILIFHENMITFSLSFSFSENYFTVKGAALILPQSDYETAFTRKATKSHGGKHHSNFLFQIFVLYAI